MEEYQLKNMDCFVLCFVLVLFLFFATAVAFVLLCTSIIVVFYK